MYARLHAYMNRLGFYVLCSVSPSMFNGNKDVNKKRLESCCLYHITILRLVWSISFHEAMLHTIKYVFLFFFGPKLHAIKSFSPVHCPFICVCSCLSLQYVLPITLQIILFGRSIGGAVALDIAADPHFRSIIAAVIVENTFTSIARVAALYLPWTRFLPGWMFRDKYDNLSKV